MHGSVLIHSPIQIIAIFISEPFSADYLFMNVIFILMSPRFRLSFVVRGYDGKLSSSGLALHSAESRLFALFYIFSTHPKRIDLQEH